MLYWEQQEGIIFVINLKHIGVHIDSGMFQSHFFCLYIFRLAYLHEGLEPKVVHRDVKSSNILLDRQWNSKVSDFGLAKLLCSENSYVTTRVMGTFGLV